jgi:hypothetical protein
MRSLLAAIVLSASVVAYAQSQPIQRGDFVRILPTASRSGTPTTPLVLRVVAVPDDQLRVTSTQLLVNDVAVTGFSSDLLSRVAQAPERVPSTVPEGHYFVMGEQRSTDGITEYWGQHSGERLQLAR